MELELVLTDKIITNSRILVIDCKWKGIVGNLLLLIGIRFYLPLRKGGTLIRICHRKLDFTKILSYKILLFSFE